MVRSRLPLNSVCGILLALLISGGAWSHEFEAERVKVVEANAAVLDGDTSTLFVQMTILNGAATTRLIGFETRRGVVGDWIEVRNVFGREIIETVESKTIRTQTAYEMQMPGAYLVITDVDPRVYSCDFGYIQVHALFEEGAGLDVAVWIDPVYVEFCN